MLLEAQKELVDYKGLGISVLGKTLKNLHFSLFCCLTELSNKTSWSFGSVSNTCVSVQMCIDTI